MARKSTRKAKVVEVKLRGRPPLAPRTKLAKWIQDHQLTVVAFTETLRKLAPKCGLTENDVPQVKTLLDAVNGRHWPHPKVMFLVRQATNGDVDLEHWVRDLTG